MSKYQIGQFVKTTENDLGIGKVHSVEDDWVTIEYFDSPTSDRFPTRIVPASVVGRTKLHQETRVYFQHPESLDWFIGRALVKTPEGYRIQFPNRQVGELPERALYVRWNLPIEDPTDHLAHKVNETPYFHDGRSPFMKSLIDQRAACGGMTGLYSSAVELEEHQIEVVRRVLEDPIQRYLLADEVGLGKTIEAGAIIRQYALDRPRDFKVLIVVPPHLCAQWKQELRQRFLFDQELGERIHVIPYTDIDQIRQLGNKSGMLVVDEAHQIAKFAHSSEATEKQLFAEIQRNAERAGRLLLLSATPVLHNEAGYLAMLHLLDPVMYPLEEVNSFSEKIQKRQEIAEVYHSFTAETEDYFLEQFIYELQEHFPDDARLSELMRELLPHLEFASNVDETERDQLIRAIRTHISETYRLHRRMLRTRRGEETQWLLPGRSGLRVVEYNDSFAVEIDQLLEEWRSEAAAAVYSEEETVRAKQYVRLFKSLFAASCALPQTLNEVVKERLESITAADERESKIPSFYEEEAILQNLLSVLERAVVENLRVAALTNLLKEGSKKAVIFLDRREDADLVFESLSEELESGVARHTSQIVDESEGWKRFLKSPDCQALVCDRRAEEGLNLQGCNAHLIHFDVPLSPNRLEQRIGRLDRYGIGKPIESLVFVPEGTNYGGRLVELQARGFGVFERSIASLQYLVENKLNELWPRVFFEGPGIIDSTIERLGGEDGEVAEEMQRVEAQSELDAIEASVATDDNFYDRLWDIEFDAGHLEEVAREWISNRVQFHREETDYENDRIIRWRFRTDRSAKHPTLLPIKDLLNRFETAVDPSASGFASYPMTFRRQTACSNNVRVARLGEPFISAMENYIRWDDRGTSFAMWRYCPRAGLSEEVELFFRFDFLIEADVEDAIAAVDGDKEITPESVRLRADRLFPPIMRTVWVDKAGNRVEDASPRELLELPYDQDGTSRFGKDFNLNSERWKMIDEFHEPSSWSSTCWDVRKKAEQLLVEEVELQKRSAEYADRALRYSQENEERLKTRIRQSDSSLSGFETPQLKLEEKINSALEAGIREPNIRLDAIGGVFLSTLNPFEGSDRHV